MQQLPASSVPDLTSLPNVTETELLIQLLSHTICGNLAVSLIILLSHFLEISPKSCRQPGNQITDPIQAGDLFCQ